MKVSLTFNITLTLKLPSKKLHSAHSLMVLYMCAKSFQNVTNPLRVIEWKHKKVIQSQTVNYDLDFDLTMVKHMHCTSSHHTWHLCRVNCESHQGFTRYRATQNTVIQCLTLNYDLDLEPTLVKHLHCTSSHHFWHLCRVIWKSHQGF